jgi:predicted dienelactone hydrolase
MKYQKPLTSLMAIAINTLTTPPVIAAEKIIFKLGPIEKSISVKSLEKFILENEEDDELKFLTQNISQSQKETIRGLLSLQPTTDRWQDILGSHGLPSANANSYLTRILNSDTGKGVLAEIGEIVRLQDGNNAHQALQTALVKSSIDFTKFSLLGAVREFPGDIYIDIEAVFKVLNESERISTAEKVLMTRVETLSALTKQKNTATRATQSIDTSPKAPENGSFEVSTQILHLYDRTRQRQFDTILYFPKLDRKSKKVPLIIISNGMTLDPDYLAFLGNHLAANGFAVGIPDTIGSNSLRKRDFLTDRKSSSNNHFDVNEYINRPLDITYLLDELERLNNGEFQLQFDLDRVGIFAYSFGAVTALSLGGAKFNFDNLARDCNSQSKLLNLSLLYQCNALKLPKLTQQISFHDRRIKSLFLFVPMGYSMFGTKNLQTIDLPTAWNATVRDRFTPMIQEQIPGFTAMKNPHKYLSIPLHVQHVPPTTADKPSEVNTDRQNFDAYLKTATTAFFKVYLAEDERYRSYLTSSDANKLSVLESDLLPPKPR